jgi:hypothetical protein
MSTDDETEVAQYHIQELAAELAIEDDQTNPIRRSILIDTVTRMVPELIAQAERNNAPIQRYVRQAVRTVGALDWGIYWFERNVTKPAKTSHTLWQHRRFPTLLAGPLFFPNMVSREVKEDRARDLRDPDKDAIEQTAKGYLSDDWYSEYLDWVIVDVLVFWECQAFISVRLTEGILTRRFLAAFYAATFLIISGVFGWLGTAKSFPEWSAGTWIVLAIVGYAFADGRWITTFINRKILRGMHDSYRALKAEGAILSPIRVREVLQSAEKDGVVWPNMIWPVLDRVIARNPAVWRVWR